ncbi:hypothetical protein CEQ90_14160 [Lewinellaceae bacterium SD302]|nr:hypothetical protein CEQ90_14160 [Lewinellaceae bacterium SD302]
MNPLWKLGRIALLPLLFFGLPGSMNGQERVYRYADGHPLDYGTVNSILLDAKGYLWLGGQSSLRRFDGDGVEYFGHARGDTTSLTNDYINDLYEDDSGRLWIAHQRGISYFDYRLEHFHNFSPSAQLKGTATRQGIGRIWPGKDGLFWVTTDGLLRCFDPFQLAFHLGDSSLLANQQTVGIEEVYDALSLENGQNWITTNAGTFSFGKIDQQLAPIKAFQSTIYKWRMRPDGKMLVIQEDSLGFYQHIDGGSFTRLATLPYPEGLTGDLVNVVISKSSSDDWYLGTGRGLMKITLSDNSTPLVELFTKIEGEEQSLTNNTIYDLAFSDDDMLLIGTRQGVSRLDLRPTHVEHYTDVGEQALCSKVTKGSAVDSILSVLIIGTEAGISLIDLNTGNANCLTPNNTPGMRSEWVINVDPGPYPHTFWVGYRGRGANLLDISNPAQPVFRELDWGGHDLKTRSVYQFARDKGGRYWLATSKGLVSYTPETGSTELFEHDPKNTSSLSSSNLLTVLVDSRNRLWVGTRGGGICLKDLNDPERGFQRFRFQEDDPGSLPSDLILHINEDQAGRIWIANPEAPSVYLEDGTFRTFGLEDGLAHSFCYGSFADRAGTLWMAFGGIFVEMDLNVEGELMVGRQISRRSGLLSTQNAQFGWSVLPDGRMALSQRLGLNIVHPELTNTQADFARILLTDFQLFDESVNPGQASATNELRPYRLPDDINELTRVDLPPGQDLIGISFAASRFRPFNEPTFAYRMAGIQDEWSVLDDRRYLSFPKLPSGEYLLELRMEDELERYSDDIRQLTIYLKAPWYQRWWAKSLFALSLAALVLGGVHFRNRQQQRLVAARLEEREELRRRSARDFHDEAGNHLSRLSLLTNVLDRKLAGQKTEEARPLVTEINQNVQIIREGMRDFIWALDPDNDSVEELALRLKQFGQELFAHHSACFSFIPLRPELNKLELATNTRRHLMLLFKEAMNNSLRHAAGAKELELRFSHQGNLLKISWTDDGSGSAMLTEHNTGMGIKNMRARAEKIGADLFISGEQGFRVEISLLLISPF